MKLNHEALAALFSSAEGMVSRGELPAVSVAVGYDGQIHQRNFGAPDDALFVGYSTTKAVTSAATWLLIQDGLLSEHDAVAETVPGFAANGKRAVAVNHLFTHTAGFPNAPFHALDWDVPARRAERFQSWTLDWEPGSRFVYHAATSMWVLAQIIESKSGSDFRAFIRARILEPLAIDDLFVGLPDSEQGRVQTVSHVGEPPDAQVLASVGIELTEEVTNESWLEAYNRPEIRRVGVPGVGGVMSAGGLARFYQGLLHGGGVWTRATLDDALTVRTGDLVDPMTRRLANRALGLAISGGDDRIFRGFAPTNSPRAFGHAGAGGQIAWADPESGISFALLTNGLDRYPARRGMRGASLSMLAATCAS